MLLRHSLVCFKSCIVLNVVTLRSTALFYVELFAVALGVVNVFMRVVFACNWHPQYILWSFFYVEWDVVFVGRRCALRAVRRQGRLDVLVLSDPKLFSAVLLGYIFMVCFDYFCLETEKMYFDFSSKLISTS